MKTARAVPGERAPCLAVRSPTLHAMGLLVEQMEVVLETRRRRERRGERRRRRERRGGKGGGEGRGGGKGGGEGRGGGKGGGR